MKDFNVVTLRAVEPEDVDFILSCENDQDVARWSYNPAPLSRQQLLTYALTYDADPFAAGQLRLIIENYDSRPVGVVDLYEVSERDLRAFVGICIHGEFRRRGYALKTLEVLSRFCSEKLGLNQIAAKVSATNPAALKLFDKAGFSHTATLRNWHRMGQSLHDIELMQLFF